MRSIHEIRSVLELRCDGYSQSEIARRVNIPRPTVRDICHRYANVAQLVEASASKTDEYGFESRRRHNEDRAYAYCLGMYLGDGYICRSGRTYRLRITCDTKYPGIINRLQASLDIMFAGARKVGFTTRQGCIDVSVYSNALPALFPQVGVGPKHERDIRLVSWQETVIVDYPWDFLAGLIHSDGCRSVNRVQGREYPRYIFTNKSADIKEIYCRVCDAVGLRWGLGFPKNVYVSKKVDVARMDEKIGKKS